MTIRESFTSEMLACQYFSYQPFLSKFPPAKPGALGSEPLKAAGGVADAAPGSVRTTDRDAVNRVSGGAVTKGPVTAA